MPNKPVLKGLHTASIIFGLIYAVEICKFLQHWDELLIGERGLRLFGCSLSCSTAPFDF
jgi:hypothetical protein